MINKIRVLQTDKGSCDEVFPPTDEQLNADEMALRLDLPSTASAPSGIVSIGVSDRFPLPRTLNQCSGATD